MGVEIHPTAIVHSGAEIGDGSSVGPYSIIGPSVRIGKGNRIGPHVVLEGLTTIGDNNQIFQFASVGSAPQDLKFKNEASRLEIGSSNIIREYVTLQPGTAGGGMLTRVGSKNLFMANSHVGHDAVVGDSNVFANSCALAGHVHVGDKVILGGLAGIHQFVRIGDLCILSAGAMVGQDVPPYCMVHGDRAELVGLNTIGLSRAGISSQDIARLRRVYRDVFFRSGPFKDRLERAREFVSDFPQGQNFLDFMTASQRGIVSARKRREDDE